MILNDIVSVKWNSKTRAHYLKFGYMFTKFGDSFNIKIEHLTKSSVIKISVKCDYCGSVVLKKYSDYNKYEKTINKDACSKCSHLKSQEVLDIKYGADEILKRRTNALNLAQDKKRHTIEFVSEQFKSAGLPLVDGQKYKDISSKLKFICKIHGVQEMSFGSLYHQKSGCSKCRPQNQSGSSNPMWQGNREIYQHFRDIICDWQSDIYRVNKGKCIISGNKATEVHHIYPFKNIVDDVFKETGLPRLQCVGDYTDSEVSLLNSKCLELHNKPNIGACLSKDMHFLFHQTYGYTGNTPEQFTEFIKLHKVVA